MITRVVRYVYQSLSSVLRREEKKRHESMLNAARRMIFVRDLNHLMKLIVRVLTKKARLSFARVYLFDRRLQNFICLASYGMSSNEAKVPFPDDSALVKCIRKMARPIRFEDLTDTKGVDTHNALNEMKSLEAALIVPSFIRNRLLGFVVLGRKLSGRRYSKNDLNFFSILAEQTALAIENCLFIKEFEDQQTHFFQVAKMADLGTMAAGIGHQINNRFNVIRLGMESALMIEISKLREFFKDKDSGFGDPLVESLTDTCQKVIANAEHGGEIVKRLLDFSRLSVGFRVLDVGDIVESTVRLWKCKRDLSGIDFKVEVSNHVAMIKGNFSEVEEILFNLLDNAADAIVVKGDAIKLGTIEPAKVVPFFISLSADNVERNQKKYVKISISENGIGMDKETQKKVFVPFFTTKASSLKGTGLGLYIIRKMVDAHRGMIEIESEYGEGTTFFVYLPFASDKVIF